MRPPSQRRLLRCASRVYGVMLLAYPATFRREYSREMALVFRDRARAIVRTKGSWALVPFMLEIVWDLLVTSLQETTEMNSINRHRSHPSSLVIMGEWMMVLPAALLFGALALRSTGGHGLSVRMALLIANWASSHMSRLGAGVVFIGMPVIVVVVGGGALVRIWREDDVVRQDTIASLGLLRRHRVVLLLASATVLAFTILIPVLAHVITD